MSVTPTLQTPRLHLRQVRETDAQDIFNYARNPNVLRYTTAETPTDIAQTMQFVMDVAHKPDDAYAWGICLKGTDRVIGVIEFGVQAGIGSVHYAMAEEYWNRGLMTEGVTVVLQWGFSTYPNMLQVRTSAVAENAASRRVMEKCGMKYVQTLQEGWEKLSQPVFLAIYAVDRK